MDEVVKPPPLPPIFCSLAESKRLVYALEIPAGVPIERLMDPDYLAHSANKLSEGFRIEALTVDNRWFAELMVRKVDLKKHEVHCWLLHYKELDAPVKPTAEQYVIKFGGAHKWRVIRVSDQEVMHHGEPTQADAQAWLEVHLGKVPA